MNRMTVLVVDDDVQAVAGMRRLLEHYGYEVSEAGTVGGGVRGLAKRPAFVFLDLELPDGEGAEVLREVRRRGMPSRVVIVSGTSDRGAWVKAAALRPDAMLTKPVDFMRVLELMK